MSAVPAREWIAGRAILGMRFGTDRMLQLLAALGDPQLHAPALHVVGTNGKSSTARLATAALMGEGLRVGTYLSPHIVDWSERIQVDGVPVGEGLFTEAVEAVRDAAEALVLPEGDAVTQFEALTAAAFWVFRRSAVQAAVVEAGLGGRFDATNVLQPHAAVALTNISLDHTELLGVTEAEIAAEKLAVCPEGHRRLVVGPCSTVAQAGVDAECARRGLVPLRFGHGLTLDVEGDSVTVHTPHASYPGIELSLVGAHQRDNLAVAVAGAEMVVGGPLDAAALAPSVGAVRLPGRLEWVSGEPPVLLDGAHNPAGIAALVESLPAVVGERRPRVAVMSMLGDKDISAMLAELAPHLDGLVATGSHHVRALPAAVVAEAARAHGLEARVELRPEASLAAAREWAGPRGVVIVAGSLYLLGDIREVALS